MRLFQSMVIGTLGLVMSGAVIAQPPATPAAGAPADPSPTALAAPKTRTSVEAAAELNRLRDTAQQVLLAIVVQTSVPKPRVAPIPVDKYLARPVAENVSEAIRLLTAAVELGDSSVTCKLGDIYAAKIANGQVAQKDFPKAIALYRQGAEAGNAICMLALARGYETGDVGLPRDKAQSNSWYRRMSETNPGLYQLCINTGC